MIMKLSICKGVKLTWCIIIKWVILHCLSICSFLLLSSALRGKYWYCEDAVKCCQSWDIDMLNLISFWFQYWFFSDVNLEGILTFCEVFVVLLKCLNMIQFLSFVFLADFHLLLLYMTNKTFTLLSTEFVVKLTTHWNKSPVSFCKILTW